MGITKNKPKQQKPAAETQNDELGLSSERHVFQWNISW